MLQDITNLFSIHSGFNFDPGGQNDQSKVMLNYINRAAKDLYNKIEADSLLKEIVLQVPIGFQVSLPPFIGELKGAREYGLGCTIPLNEIGTPRFSSDTQKFRWRNWTHKGTRAIQADIQNASLLTLWSVGVEAIPAQVTIVGRGANSHRITETVVMSTTIVNTINSFIAIESIGSTSIRNYDINVNSFGSNATDITGISLAVLYNNEPYTEYNIVDVSRFCWSNLSGLAPGGISLVELLYKEKFYPFINATDTFIAPGFDDAIGYEAIALWLSTQPDRAGEVTGFRIQSVQCIDNNITNDENGMVRKLQFKPSATVTLFKRFRNAWDWRRGSWNGRY